MEAVVSEATPRQDVIHLNRVVRCSNLGRVNVLIGIDTPAGLLLPQLKAQKLNDEGKKEADSASLDDVKIEQEEYLKYLLMAYKKADFPKPRNMVGLAKDLPQEEMETLMFTHIEVSDEDLRELAKQRAKVVRELLLKAGQIEPGRIFLVEPKSIFAEQKETVKGSRVELAIK